VPRILPERTRAVLEQASWPRPAVFEWLQREGKIAEGEMHRVFNAASAWRSWSRRRTPMRQSVSFPTPVNRVPHRPHRSAQRRRASGRGGLKNGKAHRADHPGRSGRRAGDRLPDGAQALLAALLSAAILCFSTWPLYSVIERRLGGRRTLAALAMTLLMVVVLVLPLALIAGSYVDDVPQLAERLRDALAEGLPMPPAGSPRSRSRRFARRRLARDSGQQGGAR